MPRRATGEALAHTGERDMVGATPCCRGKESITAARHPPRMIGERLPYAVSSSRRWLCPWRPMSPMLLCPRALCRPPAGRAASCAATEAVSMSAHQLLQSACCYSEDVSVSLALPTLWQRLPSADAVSLRCRRHSFSEEYLVRDRCRLCVRRPIGRLPLAAMSEAEGLA